MNKRQKKKADRKVVYPVIDEFPLLAMTPEQRTEAIRGYEEYCQKHCRFFHYRDRNKVSRRIIFYSFYNYENDAFSAMLRRFRKYGRQSVGRVRPLPEGFSPVPYDFDTQKNALVIVKQSKLLNITEAV